MEFATVYGTSVGIENVAAAVFRATIAGALAKANKSRSMTGRTKVFMRGLPSEQTLVYPATASSRAFCLRSALRQTYSASNGPMPVRMAWGSSRA